ncbi:FAD-binding domain-containing protein [Trametes coccinea BRFM310]|uniref:FAD-binding domain-containing protein n=1 Tax=Trametes coccinea (strain BRFM310) TaxID=1353009 RepID=A0A1Y2IZ32_TRAC3|nr:FAD-binding domain-containing protein [Trametes coccinea BRFM310]
MITLELSIALVRAAADATQCRCLYGEQCWPSQDEFASLAAQVSQPLVTPTPPAKPCYTDPQSTECATAVNRWIDGNWRADQPGAMESSNFETYTFPNGTIQACYLNTTLGVPCGQGSVSVIGVDARTVADVQAAISFAAQNNLRLAVKNTGHDYFGRSNGRGTFMLWTHNMKNVTVQPAFRPAGAPSNESQVYQAVTIGAGIQWHEAFAAANASGLTLVGGIGPGGSVGAAGGWLQGGGHSSLSPSYGLGVDNVLEFSVVTSTGAYLVANAYQHSDLYWALRGGGGGTYGVVTSATYRAWPSTPLNVFSFTALANSTEAPALKRAVVGLTIGPYLAFVQGLAAASDGALTIQNASLEVFPSFYAWYAPTFAGAVGEVGTNTVVGSWLLPRDVVDGNYTAVTETLMNMPNGVQYLMVAGGAVSRVDPASTGLNPAWRKAAVHVTLLGSWPEGATASEISEVQAGVDAENAKLRALAPDSGAYFNEASFNEPNFQEAFFGSHYDRLKAIKAAYDPIDLFVVHDGVGSDEWDDDLVCRV